MADDTIRFEVTKLNCGGCAGRAQRALAGVPGVDEASVNFANRMAQVEGSASVQALRDALPMRATRPVRKRSSLPSRV